MMSSAQVVETSVNVTNNSHSRDYSHPDDQTTQTGDICNRDCDADNVGNVNDNMECVMVANITIMITTLIMLTNWMLMIILCIFLHLGIELMGSWLRKFFGKLLNSTFMWCCLFCDTVWL